MFLIHVQYFNFFFFTNARGLSIFFFGELTFVFFKCLFHSLTFAGVCRERENHASHNDFLVIHDK